MESFESGFSQRKPSLRVMKSPSITNTKDMDKKPRNAIAVRTTAVDGKSIYVTF